MRYLQRAQNDDAHLLEPARVIPWPKEAAKGDERHGTEKATDGDGMKVGKPVAEPPPREVDPTAEESEKVDAADEKATGILKKLDAGRPPDHSAKPLAKKEQPQKPESSIDMPDHGKTPQVLAPLAKPSAGSSNGHGKRGQMPEPSPDERNWFRPIAVQPELPWTERPAPQAPVAAERKADSLEGPQDATEVARAEERPAATGAAKQAAETSPAADVALPAKDSRKGDLTPTAPASPLVPLHAPSTRKEETQPEIAAVSRVEEVKAREVWRREALIAANIRESMQLHPVNAPTITIGALPEADEAIPEIRRMRWKLDAQRNWFLRLLNVEGRDPRRGIRESLPNLVAYFFTGGIPTPHAVRNISITGIYLVTHERWYKGTVLQMTLTDRQQSTLR
jgi:hypothetical protein